MRRAVVESNRVNAFGSVGVASAALARVGAVEVAGVDVLSFAAGGLLGRHPTRLWQLFTLLSGTNWAGSNGVKERWYPAILFSGSRARNMRAALTKEWSPSLSTHLSHRCPSSHSWGPTDHREVPFLGDCGAAPAVSSADGGAERTCLGPALRDGAAQPWVRWRQQRPRRGGGGSSLRVAGARVGRPALAGGRQGPGSCCRRPTCLPRLGAVPNGSPRWAVGIPVVGEPALHAVAPATNGRRNLRFRVRPQTADRSLTGCPADAEQLDVRGHDLYHALL